MLRINALGGLSVERDGRPLAGAAAQPRRLAILAMLARADDRGVTRDRVVTLLWPDTDEERARRALTQALYALRQDLGDEDTITGVKELRLNPELVATDLRAFVSARARAALDDAAAAYRGPFLDGFHIPGAEEFDRWAEEERRVLAREFADLIERLATLAESRGDFPAAVSWWQRLAGLDPLNARIAVSLMRALEAAGDRNGAIQHARLHEALVEQNLDLPPDREVIALASRLRRESRRQSTEAQTALVNEAVLEEESGPEVGAVPVLPVAPEDVVRNGHTASVEAAITPPVAAPRAKIAWRWWTVAGAIAAVVVVATVHRLPHRERRSHGVGGRLRGRLPQWSLSRLRFGIAPPQQRPVTSRWSSWDESWTTPAKNPVAGGVPWETCWRPTSRGRRACAWSAPPE